MKKLSILLSIIILVGFFVYALRVISDNNLCTWVRTFICQKEEKTKIALQNETTQTMLDAQKIEEEKKQQEYNQSLIDANSTQYSELRKVWDSFIHLCNPAIIESTGSYQIDYTACNLTLDIGKDLKTVGNVSVNNLFLSQDQIDESLAKLWFSF